MGRIRAEASFDLFLELSYLENHLELYADASKLRSQLLSVRSHVQSHASGCSSLNTFNVSLTLGILQQTIHQLKAEYLWVPRATVHSHKDFDCLLKSSLINLIALKHLILPSCELQRAEGLLHLHQDERARVLFLKPYHLLMNVRFRTFIVHVHLIIQEL